MTARTVKNKETSTADKTKAKQENVTFWVRTRYAESFWRGGVKFTKEWQPIDVNVVGEEAFLRITNEPALECQPQEPA